MTELDFEALTREQRTKILLKDSQTYIDMVPLIRWNQILDALARNEVHASMRAGITEGSETLPQSE